MPDIARGPSTTAETTLGDVFQSQINRLGDRDWIRIDLTKGDWVQVDLGVRDGGEFDDPFLRILDKDRALVARNDDGPDTNLDSQLVFHATYTGSYYIEASGLDGDHTFKYTLETQSAPTPPAEDSLYWGTQMEDTTITVYFAAKGERYDGYTSEGFKAYEKAQFQKAFNRIEAVSDLRFEIVDDPDADFRLVLDLNELENEDGSLGQFNPPEFGGRHTGVGVFNGSAWDRQSDGNLDLGGEGFVTITHELLHGLGLAHPHDDGGGSSVMPGVTRDFDDYGLYDLNQGIFTTMSYNSGYFTGSNGSGPRSNYGFESGPMALDIAVLQSLYGTGDGHKAGNTSYGLPDQNRAGTKWQAIWDTDGVDDITYEGARDAVIDLRAATLIPGMGAGGVVSAAKGIAGGYTIANGVWIENANSDAGADRLTGNGQGNTLSSGSGADRLNGRGGDDLLVAGKGRDQLEGGDGADRLRAGDGNDVLRGGAGADVLRGQNNADILQGDGGADVLRGGAGADTFVFGAASDSAAGAGNRDTIADFGRGQDRIDLSAVDGNITQGGVQSFDYIGTSAFDAAGQVRVTTQNGNRLVQGDLDGDGQADFEILLIGATDLRAADFSL